MEKNNQKTNIKYFLFMHAALLFLSLNAVCSKQAATYEFFSFKWFFFYGIVLFILFVYAIVWQIILAKLPLTVAFSNKAICIFWGMVWGALLFGETITPKMIIGAIIIFAGIIIISTEKIEEERGDKE